uniref:Uncharacterized protein n=1 Tax=Odontella aurita TaxID=265563 RepID=A0A7S4IWX6_9STRA|mmetsp:Transcript_31758/g.95070  ORF Transcript_31758/g.95070 Transcript_31758/m.95070 type:complete len:174 (+) Transcript_31758:241-762(+)
MVTIPFVVKRLSIAVDVPLDSPLLSLDVYSCARAYFTHVLRQFSGATNYEAVSPPQSLAQIFPGRKNITDVGAIHLEEFMRDNIQFRALGLRSNPILDAGKKALADSILLWCSCHYFWRDLHPVFQLDIPEGIVQLKEVEENNENLKLDKVQTYDRIHCRNNNATWRRSCFHF